MRASLGPRIARVHVGAGRTGFSTGAGPVGFYASLGGGPRRGSRPSRRSPAQATKEAEAERLLAAFNEITSLHRTEFPGVTPPVAPPVAPVEHAKMLRRHERQALSGLGWFARAERRAARERSRLTANAEAAAWVAEAERERAKVQQELDRGWERLLANDPDALLGTLAEAFDDNEAPAAAVDVQGTEVSLVVLVPGVEAVPERMSGTTQAGNLTLRKLNKTDRAVYHLLLVAGHVLVTLREAFAVAPGIEAARVVALRRVRTDSYGSPQLECLLAGRFQRRSFDGVRWHEADAANVLTDTADELLLDRAPRTGELRPIDVRREPELARLITNVDLDEP
ncbi:hypothetical protein Ppa06_21140 [Planomonospora parontospora subsp. parontospora]|uniref:Uncharacterized protein n=3 Tax=Planomonospora parontospora TaxID=58119 RepID=A0AA37F407_9ACTN|nr:hypothetical protein GCM10010126_22410 [Planomonospora parontospora]GII08316.1 hypothetical protein Ppa06_21140 [Planomonospora parontospora subsp. parontospora]